VQPDSTEAGPGLQLPSPVAAAPRQQAVVSLWDLKPWWCQPWTILLTGIALMVGSWVLLHLWWMSALVTMAVSAWWILFLSVVPAAWRQEQEAKRLEQPTGMDAP
jgi:hypothetical protein